MSKPQKKYECYFFFRCRWRTEDTLLDWEPMDTYQVGGDNPTETRDRVLANACEHQGNKQYFPQKRGVAEIDASMVLVDVEHPSKTKMIQADGPFLQALMVFTTWDI